MAATPTIGDILTEIQWMQVGISVLVNMVTKKAEYPLNQQSVGWDQLTVDVSDTITSGAAPVDFSDLTGQIDPTQIAAGEISGVMIANGSITATHIVSGTITATQIAASTITATQIAAATITSSQIQAGAINADRLYAGSIQAQLIQTQNLAASSITASVIAANTITATQIAAGTITTTELAADSVTSAKIVAGTIQASDIQSGTITATEIASGTITTALMTAGTINADRLSAGTITSSLIAANAITSGLIASGAVTATKISVSQLSAVSADMGSITAGTITGATFRTSSSNPKVQMDSTGIFALDSSGTVTFKADAATGKITTLAGIGGGNLLYRSSFEPLNGDYSSFWAKGTSSTWQQSSGAGNFFFGGYSLVLQRATTAGPLSLDNSPSQPVAIPAQAYTATAYLKCTTGATAATWYLTLGFYDGSNALIGTATASTPTVLVTSSFTRLFLRNVVAPSGTRTVRITIRSDDTIAVGEGAYIDGVQVETGTIETSYAPRADEILPQTVTTTEIKDATIVGSDVAANTIAANNIVANTITASQIAAATITGTQIAAVTVTAGNIVSGTITATQISSGTITATQLSATAIDAMTITGATFRTASSGARVQLTGSTTNNLAIYNSSGTNVLTLDGTTGLQMLGYDASSDPAGPNSPWKWAATSYNTVEWMSAVGGTMYGRVFAGSYDNGTTQTVSSTVVSSKALATRTSKVAHTSLVALTSGNVATCLLDLLAADSSNGIINLTAYDSSGTANSSQVIVTGGVSGTVKVSSPWGLATVYDASGNSDFSAGSTFTVKNHVANGSAKVANGGTAYPVARVNSAGSGVLMNGGTNTLVFSTSSISAQKAIAHGLGATPFCVLAMCFNPVTGRIVIEQSQNADSTNIYLTGYEAAGNNINNTQNIYWFAIAVA